MEGQPGSKGLLGEESLAISEQGGSFPDSRSAAGKRGVYRSVIELTNNSTDPNIRRETILMRPTTTFGQALRELRRAAGVTQRELAQRAGVDFSYISKLENDRLPPPAADTVVAICRALGVSEEGLLALIGKIPSEVGKDIARSPAAQRFLRVAQSMRLTEPEWRQIRAALSRLRESESQ
jgi:transcriptional regulator with XRE-family HTH domain